MLDGRRDDSSRRRQRVLAALDQAAAAGDPITRPESLAPPESTAHSSTVTATCWRKSMRCRQNQSPMTTSGPPSPERRCRQTCSPPTNAAARLNTRIHQLEKRLSEALGEHTWRESGLGAPADIDALHQRITQLEQHNLDLQQQLDERDDDLAAARAANRELMARLNTPSQLDEPPRVRLHHTCCSR